MDKLKCPICGSEDIASELTWRRCRRSGCNFTAGNQHWLAISLRVDNLERRIAEQDNTIKTLESELADVRTIKAQKADPDPRPVFCSFEIDWSCFPYLNQLHTYSDVANPAKLELGQLVEGYRIIGFGDSLITNSEDFNYSGYVDSPCNHLGNRRFAYGRLEK